MSDPARPAGVPANAWWSPKDNEWILGDKDEQGRLQGVVTYWRPDGSLVCTCDHVDDKPHGVAKRFHETGEVSQHCHYVKGELHGLRQWFMTDGHTTEKPRAQGMGTNVWRGELDYENGAIVAFRFWDRDGMPVDSFGKPLAKRPANVPPGAVQNKAGMWVVGTWNEKGEKVGTHRFWTKDGVLDNESTHDGDMYRLLQYRADGTRKFEYGMSGKALAGAAAAWRRDGTQLVRATFGDVSTIEHLGAGGTIVRATTYAPAPDVEASAPTPTEDDQLIFDAIDEEDASAIDAAESLSPAGMAVAIGRGWGGDEDRDTRAARAFRKLVTKVAPPSLASKIAEQQLDRMPRLQTPQRVTTVIDALAGDASVDEAALRAALIGGGGPGTMLALADPDRALAYLRSRISDDGETLKLANLGLVALPPQIGRFHHIPRLYGEGNRLTTLPDEIGDMFLLSWLNLAKNRITSLPKTLAWLPNLRVLYLTDNGLRAIPSTVFDLSDLHTLSIGDNELTEIPEAIGDMASLADLSLYDNQLRDLPKSLAKCPLTFLHLGDHLWEEPPAVLGECTKLETLWIASRALKRLPAAICKLPNLKELMLWYSSVTEVPDELYEMTQLKELRIKHNPLPDEVYKKLEEALPNTAIY
ncbi:MAG: hypothetical protein AB7L94_07305 [Kofleriaceae bacterium]